MIAIKTFPLVCLSDDQREEESQPVCQFCIAGAPDVPNTSQPTSAVENTPTTKPIPTIAPDPTSTQADNLCGLDHVSIYLVTMGDNGTSGKAIGCGDILVPVDTVQVFVNGEALEKLLILR